MKPYSYKEFVSGGKKAVRYSFLETLCDLDTPLSYFMKMRYAYPEGHAFLLESAEQKERTGRFSIIGFDPYLVFKSKDKTVILEGLVRDEFQTENPFLILKEIVRRLRLEEEPPPVPLLGPTGHVGYDVVRFFEKIPLKNIRTIDVYDMYFIFPRKIVIFDNYTRKMTMIVLTVDGMEDNGKREEMEELKIMVRFPLPLPRRREMKLESIEATTSKEEFERMVSRAKEYIYQGHVIQVVLSQRFKVTTNIDSLSLYRALRFVNPSPYMFFIDFPEYSLVGSSPETMVKMEGGEIEVRPIAGTRPRGKTREEDEKLARELISDEKELAEHLMLVDLGRNDVGRVAQTGSVVLPEFMGVERYSHVMHIVSSVKGRIKDGLDCFDAFVSCFPAGTVTGAPKIRAMEIIEEIEKEKREFYAGAAGYFTYEGDMDFCIVIRTLLKKGEKIYIQAGAGIVADSLPEREYYETLSKAEALMTAIRELKEIMEWS